MALKTFAVRISNDDHAHITALAKEQNRAIGRVVSDILINATIHTVTQAIQNRFTSDTDLQATEKKTSYLVEPAAIDNINDLSARTGLPVDLITRLTIEKNYK